MKRSLLAALVLIAPLHSEGEPKLCRHLLAEYPPLKIVTLSGKEDAAFMYTSVGGKKRLNELSEPSILGALRASSNQP